MADGLNMQKIEEAGADALELNIYYIPTDLSLNSKNRKLL